MDAIISQIAEYRDIRLTMVTHDNGERTQRRIGAIYTGSRPDPIPHANYLTARKKIQAGVVRSEVEGFGAPNLLPGLGFSNKVAAEGSLA
jgi:hypothetical protein